MDNDGGRVRDWRDFPAGWREQNRFRWFACSHDDLLGLITGRLRVKRGTDPSNSLLNRSCAVPEDAVIGRVDYTAFSFCSVSLHVYSASFPPVGEGDYVTCYHLPVEPNDGPERGAVKFREFL